MKCTSWLRAPFPLFWTLLAFFSIGKVVVTLLFDVLAIFIDVLMSGHLVYVLPETTARQQPVPSSCQENEVCQCHGTAYYGRKHFNGKPGSGAVTSLVQMMEFSHQSKEVSGPFMCSLSAFRHDPSPGERRGCVLVHVCVCWYDRVIVCMCVYVVGHVYTHW
jgi:hypothetical protein